MPVNAEAMNHVITRYIISVKEVFPIDKVFLFGSYAKGTQKEDSDIDICFFSNSFEGKKSVDILCELLTIARKYPSYDIEPKVFLTSDLEKDNPFVKEIIRTGREIMF
ncbi:MAG: nucleotidyltransferase domain-containing protein [Lachnoclostridium sp.]|jgi:predicted nucleotidyltransferase|nr:nucleotidyltransferase domain-containing protein [Lachnoclostridium sp.]